MMMDGWMEKVSQSPDGVPDERSAIWWWFSTAAWQPLGWTRYARVHTRQCTGNIHHDSNSTEMQQWSQDLNQPGDGLGAVHLTQPPPSFCAVLPLYTYVPCQLIWVTHKPSITNDVPADQNVSLEFNWLPLLFLGGTETSHTFQKKCAHSELIYIYYISGDANNISLLSHFSTQI